MVDLTLMQSRVELAMESMQDYAGKMQWEKGLARQHCAGREGCEGPVVSNVDMGEGTGRMIVTVGCEDCACRIRDAIPEMNVNDEPKIVGNNLH